MSKFQGNTRTGKDEWLTPPELIKALGEFDLDPCAPVNRPWDTAKKHFTIHDNGLLMDWGGGKTSGYGAIHHTEKKWECG